MQIIGSELWFGAQHNASRTEVVRERLQLNARQGQPGLAVGNPPRGPSGDRADISAEARARAAQPNQGSVLTDAPSDADSAEAALAAAQEEALNDPQLRVLLRLIELLTGRAAQIFDVAELSNSEPDPAASDGSSAAPASTAPRGLSLTYQRDQIIEETELTQFRATGVIRTADGQEIRFQVELSMSRYFRLESSERLEIGAAPQRKDPLVINFEGNAAQLTDQRFRFDLDADGRADSLASLAAGSGFIAFDRNGNGVIDNGRELFGAITGNGYAELARLDSDSNGWIDAADPAFAQLRVWFANEGGSAGRLLSLSEAGVSALSLANAPTPFALRGSGNSDLGQIRATGLYLDAQNRVGTTQQIDFSV